MLATYKQYINFTKMHCNGNDFIVIDRIEYYIADNIIFDNVKSWADRHKGVGFDGIIIVDPPQQPDVDFDYRIINSSGEEVKQCGNGAVCFGQYVTHKCYTNKQDISVQICGRNMLLATENCGKIVTVNMGIPSFISDEIPCKLQNPKAFNLIQTNNQEIAFSCVSMGNPHAVSIVDDVHSAEVQTIGKALQNHNNFPEQVNVGFMKIHNKDSIDLRVFERGAGETLCCGSGACAAVVAGNTNKLLNKEVAVKTLGGTASVFWAGEEEPVFYTSTANIVFSAKLSLN